VRRILKIIFKAQQTTKGGEFDQEGHHQLARKIASEGMVLLKNNALLPLQGQRKIAVIGRAAQFPHFQGGGSSHVNPTQVSIPLEELKKVANHVEFTYAEGYTKGEDFRQDLIDEAVAESAAADAAILFIALPTYIESEGYDRQNIDLTQQQVALIKAVSKAQPQCVVVLNNGAAVAMQDWIEGVAAVLEGWLMGQAGGAAVADILLARSALAASFLRLFQSDSKIRRRTSTGQGRLAKYAMEKVCLLATATMMRSKFQYNSRSGLG